MMVAIKDNCVYKIESEADKAVYISRGFDVYDENGDIVAYGAGKTVPIGKYMEAINRIKELEAELAKVTPATTDAEPKKKQTKKAETPEA